MAKALIVFGSTTGNTEKVANQIGDVMTGKGVEVTVKNVTDTKVAELGGEYDVTLLGSSTWGDSEIEFQEDFQEFFDNEMGNAELKGKKVAVFGCGDSSYEFFCGAVDELEEKVKELGAENVNVGLKIDGDPDDASSDIDDWAAEIADSVA